MNFTSQQRESLNNSVSLVTKHLAISKVLQQFKTLLGEEISGSCDGSVSVMLIIDILVGIATLAL